MKGFSIVLCLLIVGCGNNSTLFDSDEARGSIVDLDVRDTSSPITDIGVADLDGLDIGTNSDATPDIEALDSSCENISFLGVANQFNATVEMVQTEDGFVVAPGEKANGYFFEVDENGIQVGESKKLFSTKSVQHSREKFAVPTLIASSPNQVATAWIESGSQVFFGCFSTLDN